MVTTLTVILVILAILLITLILMQPDKSQTTAKTLSSITTEKDGIEKVTEYVSVAFLVLSLLLMIVSKIQA